MSSVDRPFARKAIAWKCDGDAESDRRRLPTSDDDGIMSRVFGLLALRCRSAKAHFLRLLQMCI